MQKKNLLSTNLTTHQFEIAGVSTQRLADEFDTPLFVFVETILMDRINSLKRVAESLPVSIFYALKANSNLAILARIKKSGFGVEVSSFGELHIALKSGFRPCEIIFNGPGKSEEGLFLAIESEILSINVDSISELERIIELCQYVEKVARISLRIVPDILGDTKSSLEFGTSFSKFGIELSDLPQAYELLLNNREFIEFVGFHINIGSQVTNTKAFVHGAELLLDLAASSPKLTDTILLNIGGGFPVDHIESFELDSQEMEFTSEQYFSKSLSFETLIKEISALHSNYQGLNIKWAMEPGRFIVSDAGLLLTRIEYLKRRDNGYRWLILDAGFNTLLESFDYDWYFHLISATHYTHSHNSPFRVAGPLCDGGDVFCRTSEYSHLPQFRLLPEETSEGDLLLFLNTGAYVLEQMTVFNGQLRPAAVLITEHANVKLIRRRETVEDLLIFDNKL